MFKRIISTAVIFFTIESSASDISQFFGSIGNKKQKSIQYTTAGTHTWIRPPGINVVSVYCWGGGGGGASGSTGCTLNSRGGTGGASGYYATLDNIQVTGDVIVTVGAGGAGGTLGSGGSGEESTFGNFLRAPGGPGGGVTHTAITGIGIAMSPGVQGGAGTTSTSGCAQTAALSSPAGLPAPVAGGGRPGAGVISIASCCTATVGYDAWDRPISGAMRYASGAGGSAGYGDGGQGGSGSAAGAQAGGPGGVGAGGGGGGNGTPAAVGGAGGVGMCQVTWWE